MGKRYRILKPLKHGREFTKKIRAFDIETYQIDRHIDGKSFIEQKFLCASIVGDGGYVFFTRDREELQKELLSQNWEGSWCFATNLEFDITHAFQDSKYESDIKPIDRQGIIYAKYQKGNHVQEFIDTWNYTGKRSVKDMGNYLNIPKLPQPKAFKRIPLTQEEWDEMREYNINDSLISYQFAVFFCRKFCQDMHIYPRITLAQTGMDFWRRNYLKQDIFQERPEVIKMHYEGSIHGGRTECLIRGLIDEPFRCYDYNSHYPARCYYGIDGKGSYPLPSSSHNCERITPSMIDRYEGITYCRVKAPYMHIPILGINDAEGKYIFPYGIMEGWFTNIELRKAIDNGYELLETKQGVFYDQTFVPFRDAIAFLYKKRKEYKEKGDEMMSMMIKTLMNAGLFGKFAQKIDHKVDIIHQKNVIISDDGILSVLDELLDVISEYEEYRPLGKMFFCKKKGDLKIPIFIMPILSSYTTAMGRLKLWENVYHIGEYVIYMDTDSIFIIRKKLESSSELGELKLEYEGKAGIFIKPKSYMVQKDDQEEYIKMKGLGKKPDMQIFNGILDGMPIEYEKFTRYKESMVRKLPFSSIIKTHKQFSLEDTKRSWKNRFDPTVSETSKPLEVYFNRVRE